MSKGPIRPSTLDGIKRLAKTLKRQGLAHAHALDSASVAAGFQNYAHTRRQLKDGSVAVPSYLAYVSVNWRAGETKETGQETLPVRLARPLHDVGKPAHLKTGGLGGFHFAAPDHLTQEYPADSQFAARRSACAAARTLAFMDATGLRPSRGHRRAFPAGDVQNGVPGMDHSSVWYHSATKSYVLADEPYETGFNGIPEHRLAWGRKHGWAVAKPNWRGMYSPDGGCVLYLACDRSKGDLLSPIVTALNSLPLPTVAADWQGFSRPLSQRFASPASAKVDPRPSTSKPVRNRGARATVGYRPPFSRTERRRPLARMPIEAHAEVGGLLTRVIAKTRRRRGVYNRLSVVRSKLDDWVQCEYDRTELPDDRFFTLYYGEGSGRGGDVQIGEAPTDRNVTKLEQAKRILAQHYRECGPLQLVLKSIDAAIESLRTWKA